MIRRTSITKRRKISDSSLAGQDQQILQSTKKKYLVGLYRILKHTHTYLKKNIQQKRSSVFTKPLQCSHPEVTAVLVRPPTGVPRTPLLPPPDPANDAAERPRTDIILPTGSKKIIMCRHGSPVDDSVHGAIDNDLKMVRAQKSKKQEANMKTKGKR
jgi:hypothetical protein